MAKRAARVVAPCVSSAPIVLIEWPASGAMRVCFASDGRFHATFVAESLAELHLADCVQIRRAVEWGRDVRSPVPSGWRLVEISTGEVGQVGRGRRVLQ